jgi:ABC-type multidrug transport system fused ATPase/permease subunit
MAKKPTQSNELSQDTKTIITIIALIFAYPAGLVLMWIWMDWARWLKILLTCLVFLPVIISFALFGAIFTFLSPWKIYENAERKVYQEMEAENKKIIQEQKYLEESQKFDKEYEEMEDSFDKMRETVESKFEEEGVKLPY